MNPYSQILILCLVLGVVDRIENGYAEIETNLHDKRTIILSTEFLPDLIAEGDSICLVSSNSDTLELLPK